MKPLATLALILALAVPASAQTTYLTGATVYDGTGGPPLADAVIHVADGRVACIGTAAACPVPDGADVVHLGGRYVTPGLVDAHVHHSQTGWLDGRPDSRIGTDGHYDYDALQRSLEANPDRWHRAYLCSGITAVFDPGGLPWTLALDGEGRTDRAHVQTAGQLLTHFAPIFPILAANGESTFAPMQTDAEAVASVRRLAEAGADAIKVWYLDPRGDADALDARLMLIGREAQAQGLPLVVHATELRNAKVALRAGAQMLVHSVEDQPIDDEFIALMRESGAVYAPTLRVGRNWRHARASAALGEVHSIDDPNGCVDDETRRVIAEAPVLQQTMPEAWRDPEAIAAGLASIEADEALMAANLHRVYEAGLPIVSATDAGNPLTLHGPSIYAELEAMEAAGLAPADVLVMATRNGAAFMQRTADFGTLEAGKLADLIVLTADPGTSTRAYRTITHVMRRGLLRPVSEFAAK